MRQLEMLFILALIGIWSIGISVVGGILALLWWLV